MTRLPAFAFSTCLIILLLILAIPLFVAEIPPLLDYPNHLARMYVLAHPHDPYLSKMYVAHWTVIPNIAIDAIMPAMLRFMPLNTAGRVMLGLAIFLSVAGTLAYAKAAFGRLNWWQLGVGLIAYHGLILMGFLNFDLGVGLALLGAAGWTAWRDSYPKAIVFLAILYAVALFFVHLFSMGFFLLLIGCHELVYIKMRIDRDAEQDSPGLLFRYRVLPLASTVVIPVILYLMAPITEAAGKTQWTSARNMPISFFCAFVDYEKHGYLLVGALVLAFLLYCVRRKYLTAYTPAVLAAGLLFLIFLSTPFMAMGTAFLSVRFSLMFAFMIFAGLQLGAMPIKEKSIAAFLLAALIGLRMISLIHVWQGSKQDIAELRQAIAPLPPGSRVVVVLVTSVDNPDYWEKVPKSRSIDGLYPTYFHLAALVVSEHQSFWPLLFSSPYKQPIMVLPPYDDIAMDEGVVPSYRVLALDDLPDALLDEAPYLEDWQNDFDYVLLLAAGGLKDAQHLYPDKLESLTQTDFAALYKIKKPVDEQ